MMRVGTERCGRDSKNSGRTIEKKSEDQYRCCRDQRGGGEARQAGTTRGHTTVRHSSPRATAREICARGVLLR